MTIAVRKSYKDRVYTLQDLNNYAGGIGDFSELPEHFEVVEGRIVELMATKRPHGQVGARVIAILLNYVSDNDLGEIQTREVGFVLKADPLTLRCPDVAFISNERLVDVDDDGFFHIAPDLAVEIVSDSNSTKEIREKTAEYFEAGSKLVWWVYPETKEVQVYRLANPTEPQTLKGDNEISGEEVIPGFSCKVRQFFTKK